MFVDMGSNLITPSCWVLPKIRMDGVAVSVETEIIIEPDNVVLPSRLLFPICVVEPDTFKEPVSSMLSVTNNEFKAASEPLTITFFQFGI